MGFIFKLCLEERNCSLETLLLLAELIRFENDKDLYLEPIKECWSDSLLMSVGRSCVMNKFRRVELDPVHY